MKAVTTSFFSKVRYTTVKQVDIYNAKVNYCFSKKKQVHKN